MAVEKETSYSAAELLKAAAQKLKACGVWDAEQDAFLLLEHATGITKKEYLINPKLRITKEKTDYYHELIERRSHKEPCQYLIGSAWFYGLSFKVTSDVLIPRMDTEVLVEEALKDLTENSRVLDMCTGSGCVAIALKKSRPDLLVTASDISEKALCVATENAERNGCEISFCKGDLFRAVKAGPEFFDLIVSNPPYVTECEYANLMDEVRLFEPKLALTAGEDGLDVYLRLIEEAYAFLKKGGKLALEIGCYQAEAVTDLLLKKGYCNTKTIKDLAGLDRVVVAFR